MKAVLLFVVLLSLCLGLAARDVHSTAIGGNWTVPSTWVGNLVPGSADNVIIDGLVYVNNHVTCAQLTISATGSLMNSAGVNWSATVNGSFFNYGSCENNPTSGVFILYLNSDIYDYGVWNNSWVYLYNTSIASIYHDASVGPITCANWVSNSTAGNYRLLSDIRFQGTLIDFYSHTVFTFQGSETYDISLNGGRLYRVILDTNGFSTLALSNGAYLYNVDAEDIILQGTVLIYTGIYFQNLVNYSTIRNWASSGNVNLPVSIKMVNYGTVQDLNSSAHIFLLLGGDLDNYGIIQNYQVSFTNTGNQYVWQAPTAPAFTCSRFGKTNSEGMVWMKSDLRFQNVIVDLNYRPIIMFDDNVSYDIDMNGGQLYRVTLGTDEYSNVTMSNDAYMWYVNTGDIILHGIVQSYGSVYFLNVVNMGTMRAYLGSQYFYVYGALTNWGTISNDTDANTYFRVSGDFANYGTINCYQMGFDGAENQYLRIGGSVAPSRFTLYSMIGPATWYLNNFWQSQGSDYQDINPYVLGVWQPVAATPGRLITLGSGAALDIPQNLTISEMGGNIKLSWDQVTGAAYYIIQTATAPEGSFTSLPDFAYDGILSDGIVRHTISSGASQLFIRIRAAN